MAETWDNMREELSVICPTNWEAIDFDTEVVGQLLECREEIGEDCYIKLVKKLDNADPSNKLITIFEVLRAVGKTVELHPSHPGTDNIQLYLQSNNRLQISAEDQSRIDELTLLMKLIYLLSSYRNKIGEEAIDGLVKNLMKHTESHFRLVFDALKLVGQSLAVVPVKENHNIFVLPKSVQKQTKVLA